MVLRRPIAGRSLLVRQRDAVFLSRGIRAAPVHRIGLGPQVRQHVVPDPRLPLVAERRDVDRRDDDPFARSRRRVRQDAAVEVDDLRSAWPRVRRIVPQARALIRGHDVGDVLDARARD